MKVLLIASECSPLVKVGGIADVIGSLPIALNNLSVDARVALPYYKPLKDLICNNTSCSIKKVKSFSLAYGDQILEIHVKTYLIENEDYISNGGVYYTPETMPSPEMELTRFAVFSKAVASLFSVQNDIFQADILHCNDWHTGLVPQFQQALNKHVKKEYSPKSIFTIHNLAYQGFSSIDVAQKLGLDMSNDQSLRWDAEDNNLDFLLQGILGSNIITTVSEKYSQEIQTPEYGEGLHEILQARTARLFGIINGISYEIFNPLNDKLIKYNFSKANWKTEKSKNKEFLQKELGLEVSNKPMIGIISRLAQQKGLDVVAETLEQIVDLGFQVVILGTGDPLLEEKFKAYNDNPSINKNYKGLIQFSEEVARKIYAASDAFLVPSRYEPCGLTQMIAMKYGGVPVARATGGLYDSIEHLSTGFLFENLTSKELIRCLASVGELYTQKDKWNHMVDKALAKDFSWNESAKKYIMLYKKALEL